MSISSIQIIRYYLQVKDYIQDAWKLPSLA